MSFRQKSQDFKNSSIDLKNYKKPLFKQHPLPQTQFDQVNMTPNPLFNESAKQMQQRQIQQTQKVSSFLRRKSCSNQNPEIQAAKNFQNKENNQNFYNVPQIHQNSKTSEIEFLRYAFDKETTKNQENLKRMQNQNILIQQKELYISELQEKMQEFNEQFMDIEQKNDELEEQVSLLKEELSAKNELLQTHQQDYDQIQDFYEEYESLKEQNQELTNEIRSLIIKCENQYKTEEQQNQVIQNLENKLEFQYIDLKQCLNENQILKGQINDMKLNIQALSEIKNNKTSSKKQKTNNQMNYQQKNEQLENFCSYYERIFINKCKELNAKEIEFQQMKNKLTDKIEDMQFQNTSLIKSLVFRIKRMSKQKNTNIFWKKLILKTSYQIKIQTQKIKKLYFNQQGRIFFIKLKQ